MKTNNNFKNKGTELSLNLPQQITVPVNHKQQQTSSKIKLLIFKIDTILSQGLRGGSGELFISIVILFSHLSFLYAARDAMLYENSQLIHHLDVHLNHENLADYDILAVLGAELLQIFTTQPTTILTTITVHDNVNCFLFMQ